MVFKDKELRDLQIAFFVRDKIQGSIDQPAVPLKPTNVPPVELTPEEEKEITKVMAQFREEDRVTDSWWLDLRK